MDTKIKVLDHNIDVLFCDPALWEQADKIRCFIEQNKILLNKTMSKESISCAFLYAVIDWIADNNGIQLTSQSIDGLSLGIHSMLANNKQFVDQLYSENDFDLVAKLKPNKKPNMEKKQYNGEPETMLFSDKSTEAPIKSPFKNPNDKPLKVSDLFNQSHALPANNVFKYENMAQIRKYPWVDLSSHKHENFPIHVDALESLGLIEKETPRETCENSN